MKQFDMFGNDKPKEEKEYTSKIKAPLYKPKNKQPHLLELIDNSKAKRLTRKINESNLSTEEKNFLKFAAQRHNRFNYSKIADYYAHASKEMQDLMEQSALVVIDFEKAYQHGYMRLAQELANQYLDTHEE